MKKLIYLVILVLSAHLSNGQCPSFTYFSNSPGSFYFAPDSTAFGFASSYLWTFGDGTSSNQTNPTHNYTSGSYQVCMTILDSMSNPICSYCDSIYITQQTNNCFYSAIEDSLNPGLFYFNAATAYPTSSVTWNFSDGTTDNGLNVSHFFSQGSFAYACMNELDNFGNIVCSRCDTLIIGGGGTGGTCGFITRPDSLNPLAYDFVAQVNITGFYTVSWNYGDGTIGAGYVGSHTYFSPGIWSVCMDVLDSAGQVICSFCNNVNVSGNPACNFTYSSNPGSGTVTYQTSPSLLYSYIWQSSTGITLTGSSGTITYPPGIFTDSVCLYAVDQSGNLVCTFCDVVFINNTNQNCNANFTSSTSGLDAYFIDLSQTSGSSTSYSWNFGDGSPISSLRFPQHTYPAPGFYTACLTIQNGTCSDTFCSMIYADTTTGPLTCNANFVVTQTVPYQLTVVNLSTGAGTSFLWSFGDGTSSNLAYPSHTYSSSGPYTLCLTVSDSSGCTSTFCDTLSVDSLGNIIYRGMSGFSINVTSPDQITSVLENTGNSTPSLVFPNPASSTIKVQNSTVKGRIYFRIFNIQGALTSSGVLQNASESIKIDQLPSGLYLIELNDSTHLKTFSRFIKE